jgi:hypothetical protein
VNDVDDNMVYTVKLVKVLAPASPDSSFDAAPGGHYLVGTEFAITGVSGNGTDDANSDATIQGDNSQTYQSGFDTLAAGTNFNSGDFTVAPGQTQVGWVSYEVPDGVKTATVQWTVGAGFGGGTPATWTVR